MPSDRRAPGLDEAQVLDLFHSCSNIGRWGADDERGTLNLITPEAQVRAASEVREGVTVSLAHLLDPGRGTDVVHRMLAASPRVTSAQDVLEVAPHGFRVTHLDALGHVAHAGAVYNGRAATDVMTVSGLAFGSIMGARQGIVTRGVLLDVARALGVECLDPDSTIEPEDLDATAAMASTPILPGDAVLLRIGLGSSAYRGVFDDVAARPGMSPRCIPWLHEKDVAVYGGDCVERLPSGYPSVPMPFHEVALAAMGLWILDNVDMESLATTCHRLGRTTFLLTVAPLPIPGGTGSAVNPLASF